MINMFRGWVFYMVTEYACGRLNFLNSGLILFVQAQFAQMRPVAMAPTVAPRMPMYPPGGPGMGQQIFYGQGPPAIIPSQVIPF